MDLATSWTVVRTTELPAATWYDETQQHFVALLERQETDLENRGFRLEVVHYQILSFPPLMDKTVSSSSLSLEPSTILRVRLPLSLANNEADEIQSAASNNSNSTEETTANNNNNNNNESPTPNTLARKV